MAEEHGHESLRGQEQGPLLVVISLFRVDNSERTRGHSMKLMKESFRMDVRKYLFSQRVLNKWNRLSGDVVKAGTVNTFKRKLEKMRMLKTGFLKDPVR